jgi:hypothetical protein
MSKILKKGFYCPSDSVYFNTWTKLFIKSAKIYAPWAHIHVHIFDGTADDQAWCLENSVTVTTEATPLEYSTNIDTKKAFWVNTRFIRIPELFDDTTAIIAIDSDSLFKNPLTEQQFDKDLQNSWVTVRGEEKSSLGSAVGFSTDITRHVYREKLLEHKNNLKWFLDQNILDIMLKDKKIKEMDLRYSDFTSQPDSIIWTGKGDRKFKKRFAALADEYRKKI